MRIKNEPVMAPPPPLPQNRYSRAREFEKRLNELREKAESIYYSPFKEALTHQHSRTQETTHDTQKADDQPLTQKSA